MKRKKAFVLKDECVACGCCIKVCPKNAVKIIQGLFADINNHLCIGCAKCRKECPASVILMKEQVNE